MRDPSLAVQKAIFERMAAHPATSAIVGDRVYDQVPDDAEFPFIHIGDDEFEPENFYMRGTCRVYGLTQGVGQVEAKALAAAIIEAMTEPLTLDAPFVNSLGRHLETDFAEDLEHGSQLADVSFEVIVQEDA